MVGYKQEALIKLGKKKGFLTVDDVKAFYLNKEIFREMNKLVALGYFKGETSELGHKIWRYIK